MINVIYTNDILGYTNQIHLIDYNNQMDGLASFLVHFIMAISAYPFKIKDPN